MSLMEVMGREGHTEVTWNSDNAEETRIARETFEYWIDKGYRAFRTGGDGGQGKQMREFDPGAEALVLVPHLQGG